MKRNFLVVAANGQVRETLARELGTQGFTVTRAASGAEAERAASSVSFDAVVIESHLQDASAEDLQRTLKKQHPECQIVVLASFDLVKNSAEHLKLGDDDYVVGADQVHELLRGACDATHGSLATAFSRHCSEALIQTLDVLVGLIELDDKFFGGSSHKVAKLARATGQELSTDAESLHELTVATLIRDIGKIGVDTEIHTAQSSYTDAQKQQMREHVDSSLRLFEHIDFPWKVLPVVRHHHERYDGTGYPDGLRGREIPLGSRVIAVVDAYVAMTSDRHHREAFDPDSALQELINQTGKQFDPEVIEAFQRVLDKHLEGRQGRCKPRVLIADEQDNFRRLLKMRLLNEGLEVQEVADLEKALEILLKDPPDLVLVDVESESAEAFQLYQELRADEKLCRIPFAFLARKTDRVLKLRALRQGIDEFFCKGDDLEELVVRVENILTREALRKDDSARRTRRGITGDLENLSLPDIVQTLAMGMKTACLSISSGDHQGKIWFENGATTHAQTNGQAGENAFYEMVRWTEGEFVIEHGVQTKEASLHKDSMFLLMEGLRLFDEARSDASQAAS